MYFSGVARSVTTSRNYVKCDVRIVRTPPLLYRFIQPSHTYCLLRIMCNLSDVLVGVLTVVKLVSRWRRDGALALAQGTDSSTYDPPAAPRQLMLRWKNVPVLRFCRHGWFRLSQSKELSGTGFFVFLVNYLCSRSTKTRRNARHSDIAAMQHIAAADVAAELLCMLLIPRAPRGPAPGHHMRRHSACVQNVS